MNKLIPAAIAAIAIAGGAYYMTRPTQNLSDAAVPAEGAPIVSVLIPTSLSDRAAIGKNGFDARCAACHGENAAGKTGYGPPLVHKIYEPSHHADMSFVLAVQNGVRSHHWSYGDMPPQSGLTRADVGDIVAYVRELQRANGIE